VTALQRRARALLARVIAKLEAKATDERLSETTRQYARRTLAELGKRRAAATPKGF